MCTYLTSQGIAVMKIKLFQQNFIVSKFLLSIKILFEFSFSTYKHQLTHTAMVTHPHIMMAETG